MPTKNETVLRRGEKASFDCRGCGKELCCKILDCKGADGNRYSYATCTNCGLMQLHPPPTEKEILSFYDETYYGNGDTKFSIWIERLRTRTMLRRAQKVVSYLKCDAGRLNVLDVGAGDGRFLEAMSKRGCQISGTELSGGIAFERAKKVPGVNLFSGDVTQSGFPNNTFDLITIWHVLEHLPHPTAVLSYCWKLLKTDGTLVVEVPNVGSWQSRITGKYFFHLDPPRHLFQYSERSLTNLLESKGFYVVQRETASFEMGVIGIVQSLENMLLTPRDLFFDMLRNGMHCAGGAMNKVLAFFFACLLIPVGLIFTLIESMFGKGPVLRFVCKKVSN